ncbi:MAG: CsgG/HfaB family protein [bacterium]|nr:CsgG/HfaB family protein [bacterium]
MSAFRKAALPAMMFFVVFFFFSCDFAFAARKRVSESKPEKEKPAVKKREEIREFKFPPVAGPKKTVAVADFENKAGVQAQWNLGDGMAEMLTTALLETDRFIVVERRNIGQILEEQDFSLSGRTVNAGAPKIGKLLNAQILVSGAVTEFSQRVYDSGSMFEYKGFSFGLRGASAHVAINLRMYDTTTGQVIASKRVEGKGNVSGLNVGYSESDWAMGFDDFKASPLGKVTQEAINEAVYFICMETQKIQWEGSIVTVKNNKVYLNCGTDSNVKIGDEFEIFRKGEELTDPGSGSSLGFETVRSGRVRVIEVHDKFSVAEIVSGENFSRGDIIKYADGAVRHSETGPGGPT